MHDDDAGYDLYIDEDVWLWPFCGKDVSTGWNVKIPAGCWGSIKNRSSAYLRRHIKVYEGVIDAGYTGPLKVVLQNMSLLPKKLVKGDRLAQLIIVECVKTEVWANGNLDEEQTTRGKKGFGSTGK